MKARYGRFTIWARLDSRTGFQMPATHDPENLHYKYRLIVQNNEGVRCAFDYYGSAEEFELQQFEMDGPTLLFAFLCVLNDAMESALPFDTWRAMNAMQCSKDKGREAYDSVQTIWPKLEKLGIKSGYEMDAMMKHLHENS